MENKEVKYYTRDGKEIPEGNVPLELDKEGYVLQSAGMIIVDFSKIQSHE